MKYGAQITTTKDGAWSVSQLIQREENKEFTRDNPPGIVFIDQSEPNAEQRLIDAVKRALNGSIKGTTGT